MKKLFFTLLALFGLVMFVGCSSCGGDKPAPKGELVLEDVVSADREYMALNYSKDYVWFESQVILNDYLDSDSCDGSFSDILNVFQYVKQVGKFEKPYVVMFSHDTKGTDSISVVQSSWLEDVVLEDSLIKLSFKEAFDIAMKSDLQKPHSIHAVLRNPLGPKLVNPQYVFGNIHKQIWVDACTGDATDSNPAFK